MRRSILACLIASASGALVLPVAVSPARAIESAAQDFSAPEPLLLRIRPPGETPRDLGSGSGTRVDDEARQARAHSEAVWARAERRSRLAIASVCTGCLTPVRPVADRPADLSGGAAVPTPSSHLAQTGTP